jgi:hypothetical protein
MKRQNFDASTYTKHVRQLANAKLYQTDIASGVPQYERKSIVSNAPLANAATNVLLQEFFPGSSLIAIELPITGALAFSGSRILVDDARLNVGTGDFTVEFYFKTTIANNNYPRFFSIGEISLSCETPNTGSDTTFYLYPGGTAIATVTNASISNKWVYLSLVRSSGTFTLYLNGMAVGNATVSLTPSDNTMMIGSDGSNSFTGQITQFRLTFSALYTANFIRPVVLLKPLAGTRLLLNVRSDDARITDSAAGLAFTESGTVSYTLIVPPIY